MSPVRTSLARVRRVAVCLIVAIAAASCGGGDGFVKPTGDQAIMVMTPSTASVNVGATTSLQVQITGGNPVATLTGCTSSNTAIATASVNGSNCSATGVSAGTATITATSSRGQTASSVLTVAVLPAALTAFVLTPPTAALTVGQTQSLTATPTNPAGATVTITYQSGNTAVATVSTSGVVTGVSAGTAVITATAQATGPNLAPASIAQTSTITVSGNACTPIVLSLPVARNGSVSATSCLLTTDIQRRGDVIRVNLTAPAALELRFVPVGFTGYMTAFPAAEQEFVFFNGNPSQEVRRTWYMPAGLTELKIGTAVAGQTGTYSFSAATVTANVANCSAVVMAGSLTSDQSLSPTDCVYSGRIADEYLVFSARSCVITMTRSIAGAMSNPYLEVYAGTQLFAFDNDGGLNSNARIALPSCKSQANDVLTIRATSFGAGDAGNYVFTVTFGT